MRGRTKFKLILGILVGLLLFIVSLLEINNGFIEKRVNGEIIHKEAEANVVTEGINVTQPTSTGNKNQPGHLQSSVREKSGTKTSKGNKNQPVQLRSSVRERSEIRLSDNFTLDARLNTSLWQINGQVGTRLAPNILGGNINIIQLSPVFPITGMEIDQVNGTYQIGTIQSTRPFTVPLVAQAVVEGVVSNGNTFIFGLSSAKAGFGVVLIGNLNQNNGSYYGINVEQGTGGTWSSAPTLYSRPNVDIFYTIQIFVDSYGEAKYSIWQAGHVLGYSTTQIGTGPFYIVMAQSEGSPYTVGANDAIWKSVYAASKDTQ